MTSTSFRSEGERIEQVLRSPAQPTVIYDAEQVDARGRRGQAWVIATGGVIHSVGQGRSRLDSALRGLGLPPVPVAAASAGAESGESAGANADASACACGGNPTPGAPVTQQRDGCAFINASGRLLTPGFIDIHSHGAWQSSFDDGAEAIRTARAGHMVHGTTRQVLSLITNPLDVMCANLAEVRQAMSVRSDILGAHLEGPFIALARKGAHDPACLRDPEPAAVDQLLQAADGCIRQVTIAPERAHGMEAIGRLAGARVVPAVGHCDADYARTQQAFDAGARVLTHIFNAMNGIHHREPGPIPAALEDSRVTAELINDGFHVQDPVVRLAFHLFPHRIALITDAMEATGCPDGAYKLGSLDVEVRDGHARLVSNGAIAGSTLTLDVAVRRAVQAIGLSAPEAVEAATLTPARALGLDRPNTITGAPLGLLAPAYAADLLLLDPLTYTPQTIIAAGHRVL
ncbi:N-acetylglucosamine-6-phosphate deacetylase [Bifidobacterium actinocoloniiforme DSM 22766]|uniref:N-acetylglucosamine-6-phosphate deacetylase n=1 Tax=Bifidobacterium actinocoloniiforme DSM 22766 TaxID=1437605 RepID=A0A086YWG3_9BIFI|nr:N-acetylglucosamine-6-phosphate deacetylase [Bifidobacterium actinocoloniiforme]AKV55809.1 N-acetylglucosamine-6-phosphate deacetylase [Bifidobacterium actinocoloniiforme DSM 22766]KFI38613.1 N-acetylglucosamine-6-phosphate deacetylase [Bifidobacterium actinocoloniiforme DSM 22766]